jgi:hypothetical protein
MLPLAAPDLDKVHASRGRPFVSRMQRRQRSTRTGLRDEARVGC